MRDLQLTDDANQADALVDQFEWDHFTNEIPHQQLPDDTSNDPAYPNLPNIPGLPYGPLPQNQTNEGTNPFRLDFTDSPPPEENQTTRNPNTVPVQESTVTAPKQPSKTLNYVTRSTTGNSKPKQLQSDFVATVQKKISKVNKKRGSSS